MIQINPGAFFFDFDGVICDSERAHMFATLKAAKPYAIFFTEEYYFEQLFGLDDRQLFEHLFKKHSQSLSTDTLHKLIEEKNAEFMDLIESDIIFFKGVIPLIEKIHKTGIPIAVVSGALQSEIETCLKKGKLTDYFQFIVSADMVQTCKPDPECYEMAFEKMRALDPKLTHESCWVLEDSPAGIASAKGAGLKTIAITNSTSADNLANADHIIENYDEIEI